MRRIQNQPKSNPGATRVDLFVDFIDFGPFWKNAKNRCESWGPPKQQTSSQTTKNEVPQNSRNNTFLRHLLPFFEHCCFPRKFENMVFVLKYYFSKKVNYLLRNYEFFMWQYYFSKKVNWLRKCDLVNISLFFKKMAYVKNIVRWKLWWRIDLGINETNHINE